jgi:predicted metal-dependent enzyme (double-stranded beta helix superfamily)
MAVFDLDEFVADCRAALAADKSQKHVRDVVARAVSDPASVLEALGEPRRAGLHALHQSDDLTILNVVWAPMMTIVPHNHHMWAVIGIYTGREDNIFWRRVAGRVEAAGAKALCVRDAELLGRDIVHSVTNPIPRLTGAIHVYGGDIAGTAMGSRTSRTSVRGGQCGIRAGLTASTPSSRAIETSPAICHRAHALGGCASWQSNKCLRAA